MAVRVGTLNINLAVNLNAFQKGLRQAERDLDKVANQFEQVGGRLTRAVTLPLLAVGTAAAKIGADFDASLSQINGLVGLSAKEVQGMRAEVLALSGPTAKAPKELADALFFITSAGLRGQEALDALRVTAKASAAGLGSITSVADAVTSAVNAYGSGQISSARATAILVATVREGKASAESLAPVFGQLLPLSSQLGVGFDQVGASLAAMTRLGFDASKAATALKGIFVTLLKPSAEAQTALSSLGLSADGLRQMVREKGLLAALETLKASTAGNEAAMAKLFPNVEGLAGVLALVGANAENTRTIFNSLAQTGVGDLDKAFAAAEGTAKFQFDKALATLQTTAIALSDTLKQVLLPGLSALSGVLAAATQSLNGMSQDQKNLALVVGLLAAAAGPAALAMSAFFKTLSSGFLILRTGISLFASLAGLISGPMIVAVGLLVLAGAMLINRWQAVKDGLGVIFDAIYQGFRDSVVGRVVESLGRLVAWAAEKLKPLGIIIWEGTAGAVTAAADEVKTAAGTVMDSLGGAMDGLAQRAGAMATSLLTAVNTAMPVAAAQTEAARAATDALTQAQGALAVQAPTIWQQIGQAVDTGVSDVTQTISSLRQAMSDTGEAMRSQMRGIASEGARSMGALTASFAKGAIDMAQFVSQMIQAIVMLIAKILILRALTAVGMGGPFAAGFVGGMFAEGGRPPVGQVSVVGEDGPELFVPDVAGKIIPNDKMASMGGGGDGVRIDQLQIIVPDAGNPRATAEAVVDVLNERLIAPTSKDVTLARRLARANSRNSERAV